MSAAALTPRVRILAVCDEAFASEIEHSVFTLEGVRHQVVARSFPWACTLSVYLLLTYPRQATFTGRVRLIDDEEGRVIRYGKFVADFDGDGQPDAQVVDLGECEFLAPKDSAIKVEF